MYFFIDLFLRVNFRPIIFMVVQVVKEITWEGRRVVWGVLCLSLLIVVHICCKSFIIGIFESLKGRKKVTIIWFSYCFESLSCPPVFLFSRLEWWCDTETRNPSTQENHPLPSGQKKQHQKEFDVSLGDILGNFAQGFHNILSILLCLFATAWLWNAQWIQ